MSFNKTVRMQVYKKYNGRCAYCGIELKMPRNMQVDHIIPKRLNGTDGLWNLNPACRQCNNHKLVFSIEEFRREISEQVNRARRTSFNFRTAERYGLIEVINKPIVFYFETRPEE